MALSGFQRGNRCTGQAEQNLLKPFSPSAFSSKLHYPDNKVAQASQPCALLNSRPCPRRAGHSMDNWPGKSTITYSNLFVFANSLSASFAVLTDGILG
jgi:hypothetical protein